MTRKGRDETGKRRKCKWKTRKETESNESKRLRGNKGKGKRRGGNENGKVTEWEGDGCAEQKG